MTKLYKLMAALLLASLVLTACGQQETPTPVMTEEPTEAATEAPTEAPTEAAAPTKAADAGEIDCMGAQAGDQLNVMYQWSGGEEEKINSILKPLVDACGITLAAESTRDPAVLDTKVQSTPPDVLFWPTTAPLTLYTDKLIPLDTVGAQVDNYASFWLDLGSMDGSLLALPVKADPKSFIWYSPTQFDAFGYTVPTTLDELDALVEQMVADGNVPWSMGNNNGGAGNGWAGTDFIQDLLLAQQGPEYVNDIISGDVPYSDQGVVDAYTLYAKWASDPTYTVGGADGTVNTPFLEAIYKVFAETPEAMMVKQSGFAGDEIVKQFPDLQYGTDFDFFVFPGVQGIQGGADYMMVFNDTPAVQALVTYLTTEPGATAWAETAFNASPNMLAAGKYPDEQANKKADALTNATAVTPDIGDTIPAPFGDAEFKAIVDIVQGADIAATLETVATAQAEALAK